MHSWVKRYFTPDGRVKQFLASCGTGFCLMQHKLAWSVLYHLLIGRPARGVSFYRMLLTPTLPADNDEYPLFRDSNETTYPAYCLIEEEASSPLDPSIRNWIFIFQRSPGFSGIRAPILNYEPPCLSKITQNALHLHILKLSLAPFFEYH